MNPNEVFYNAQPDTTPLNALLRAKSNLAISQMKKNRANQQVATQQLEQQVEPQQVSGSSAEMQSPFDQKFRVSQQYGVSNPKLYKGVTADARHHGLDLATPEGTALKSPIAGKVEVGQNKWYGNYVKIKADDGTEIQFSHLSSVDDLLKQIEAKKEVLTGQLLGRTGNTGYSTAPHVDIMAWRGGQQINPMTLSAIKNATL